MKSRFGAVAHSHLLAASCLREGDVALDATAGNGGDTVFLARCVGASGRVFAIDIQTDAVESVRQRLLHAGVADRVVLRSGGHECLREVFPELRPGRVTAAMFNLGYLPGSDRGVITRPETTLAALSQAAELLAAGGVLTVACYPGHPGGRGESDAVRAWAGGLDPAGAGYTAIETHFCNASPEAPFLIAVERTV